MFHIRRTFESEKGQLQELNSRLSQYLSRAKQLEKENAVLIAEIHNIRQDRPAQWENQHMAELRQMRRMVEQLAFEKSKAEMEREKLRQELLMVQTFCSEEKAVSKGIGGELQSCERELHQAHNTNAALEARLIELENEYKFLEDAHRQEIAEMRNQAHSRIVPVITQTYHGPPAPSMEEVEQFALSLSESWMETYDMYRMRVEEMEQSIKADQARLEDMEREKMQYTSELNKLRAELDRQSKVQIHLEDQLIHMQDTFRADVNQYQVIIDELEHERVMLANAISGKLQEHQDLLKVKMDLGMEVAAYRALLEGEGRHGQMRSELQSRERIIDIKMPARPHTPKALGRIDIRSPFQLTGFDRYMEPITGVRTATLSSQAESRSASRVVPISVSARAHQSPPERRDMVAFTKASQAAATATTASTSKPSAPSAERKKDVVQEKSVKVKEVSHQSAKGSYGRTPDSLTAEQKSVKVVTPPLVTLDSQQKQKDNKSDLRGQGKLPDSKDNVAQKGHVEKKVLDTVLMEEIIENVMKPAGLGVDLSAPDSKMTYHVEKMKDDDGTTKTQIILESKVQEDVDLSADTALEELLSKGVKTVTLEDIKGTSTASMIQNIIGLGLKEGESMENKRVNIKIIEEPVESPSDEEAEMIGSTNPEYFQPSSMSYQIEELENVHQASKQPQMGGEAMKASSKETDERNGSVRIQESSTDMGTPYSSQDQESQEYFVSTPEDNLSDAEEGGGFASYGHYGVVDDLSDERYYQEGVFPVKKHYSEESDSFRDEPEEIYEEDMRSYVRDSIPGCIIEEEVRVSPMVQESVLDILKEETLDPKDQLKGALEKLKGTVSGPLKEELSRLTQAELQGADNVSVDIRKMQQTSDNGTTTIVAELNVTQSLENSGLLGNDDMSEEQIMAALRSNPELQKAFSGGAQGGYTMKVSKQEVTTQDMPWVSESEGARNEDFKGEISKSEHHIKLGPNETTFTFQMDANSGLAGAGGIDIQGLIQQEGAGDHDITGAYGPKLKVSQEKKVATVFLESSKQE